MRSGPRPVAPGSASGGWCELSDDWRPDRSGVIVRPDGLTTGEITLYVVRDTDFLRSDDLFETLAGWIDNGIALALSRPGPVGTSCRCGRW